GAASNTRRIDGAEIGGEPSHDDDEGPGAAGEDGNTKTLGADAALRIPIVSLPFHDFLKQHRDDRADDNKGKFDVEGTIRDVKRRIGRKQRRAAHDLNHESGPYIRE